MKAYCKQCGENLREGGIQTVEAGNWKTVDFEDISFKASESNTETKPAKDPGNGINWVLFGTDVTRRHLQQGIGYLLFSDHYGDRLRLGDWEEIPVEPDLTEFTDYKQFINPAGYRLFIRRHV